MDEDVLEEYMESGDISDTSIARVISEEKLFPVYFGSALKMDGVDELLSAISLFTNEPCYSDEFSARVYKILRDKNNNRLTFLIEGIVPVSLVMDYAASAQRYTGGLGEIRIELAGYFPCHNAGEIIWRDEKCIKTAK